MKWAIEIKCKINAAEELRLLKDLIAAINGMISEHCHGFSFLVHGDFQSLQSSSEVRQRARGILSDLQSCGAFAVAPLEIMAVLEFQEDGNYQKFYEVEASVTLSWRVEGAPSGVIAEGPKLSEKERKETEKEIAERSYQARLKVYKKKLVLLQGEAAVRKIYKLLESSRLSTGQMWGVFEIIEDDMGGALRELTTKADRARFSRSINHQDSFGLEARHLTSKELVPNNPMGPREAEIYIRELAGKWLDYRYNKLVS